MAKYSYEFKLKLVQEYINGEGGYKYISDKYSLPDKSTLRQWVNSYKTIGENSLMRSRKRTTFTFDFKLHIVELYLTTDISYQELALQNGISNPSMLCKWVNDFRIAGPDALKPRTKGRPSKMPKNISKKKENEESSKIDSDELKRVKEENLKLRIENAYLKELRRLRLEEITLKKKRE